MRWLSGAIHEGPAAIVRSGRMYATQIREQLRSCAHDLGFRRPETQALDTTRIGFQHFDLETSMAHDLAPLRHAADERDNKSTERVDILFGFIRLECKAGLLREVLKVDARIRFIAAIGQLL